MIAAKEGKMVALKSKAQALKGESLETQNSIGNHLKAARHHELAAKYHLEAVNYIELGNFYEAEESAFIAHGHYTLAGQYQSKTSRLFNW